MASRFVVADNLVVEELRTCSENSNTRKKTNYGLCRVFKKLAAFEKHRRRHGDIRGSIT
jgi:hypothetical protein